MYRGRQYNMRGQLGVRCIQRILRYVSITYSLWNSLPVSVKSEGNIVSFRRRLKTYLFNAAYPP